MRVEKIAGRRTKKRKPKDLPHKIKRSRPSSTPVRRRDESGPSRTIPAPPRSPSPPASITRSSRSNIGTDSHHNSEEDSSDDAQSFDNTESESEGTEYSDNESQQLSDTTSAGLRKKLHRYIQRKKDCGGRWVP